MATKKVQFVVDGKGRETAAIVPIKLFNEMVEAMEDAMDMTDARAIEANRSIDPHDLIPFEVVSKEIEARYEKYLQTGNTQEGAEIPIKHTPLRRQSHKPSPARISV